jgi:hypothetical protein
MRSFKKFLSEQVESLDGFGKLKHLEHVEDLMFHHGEHGYHRAKGEKEGRMRSFRSFIPEADGRLVESIRVGLPHVYSTKTARGNLTPSLSVDQFDKLTKGGKVHISGMTEKTDGQTFKMGHDQHGFYTQHSGSGDEKIRSPEGHIERSKRRAAETGKPYDPKAPTAFANFHGALQRNQQLQAHLKSVHQRTGKDVVVKGEAFNNELAVPSDTEGEVKFVHTPYKKPKGLGTFVIHSRLPENEGHDTEHFKKLSGNGINFDDDRVAHKPGHVDVQSEVEQFKKLDHALISSRTTPTNKQAKLAEIDKFNAVKKSAHGKITSHLAKLKIQNKWGSGTEGLIVHPSENNPDAPRFKIINTAFKAAKDAGGRFGGNGK